MIKILQSEFYRIKHTLLPQIYFILPFCYAGFMYFLYLKTSINKYPIEKIIEIYLVIQGGVLPIIISLITSKVIEIEANAGHFQVVLLESGSRIKAYLGKLTSLLLSTAFSIFLSALIFALLFKKQNIHDWTVEVLLVFIGCIPLYLIHIWTSFKFGSGASIILGFLESLFAFLSLTNLGDKIWYYLPNTWSIRLSLTYLIGKARGNMINREFIKLGYVAIPLLISMFTFSLIWFCLWDGRKNSE